MYGKEFLGWIEKFLKASERWIQNDTLAPIQKFFMIHVE